MVDMVLLPSLTLHLHGKYLSLILTKKSLYGNLHILLELTSLYSMKFSLEYSMANILPPVILRIFLNLPRMHHYFNNLIPR
jgi:hypothetical protein